MTRRIHFASTSLCARSVALVFLAFLAGCASSGSGGSRARGPITLEELEEVQSDPALKDLSLLEVVRVLRPSWVARLQGGCADEQQMSRQELEEIPIFNTREIRLLSASEALARCGIGADAVTATGRYLYVIRKRFAP